MDEFRLTVGIPASGKSTLAREWEGQGYQIVSSDETRKLMLGSMEDFSDEDGVWDSVHWQLDEALREGRPVALDATNLVPRFRKQWLLLADIYRVKVAAYRFEVEFHAAMNRNSARDRQVPLHIMDRMWGNWLTHCSIGQLEAEGFTVR